MVAAVGASEHLTLVLLTEASAGHMITSGNVAFIAQTGLILLVTLWCNHPDVHVRAQLKGDGDRPAGPLGGGLPAPALFTFNSNLPVISLSEPKVTGLFPASKCQPFLRLWDFGSKVCCFYLQAATC